MLNGIPLFGSSAPPGVRRPVFEVQAGGGSSGGGLGELAAAASSLLGVGGASDPWQNAVVSIVVEAGTAPEVDGASIVLSADQSAPEVRAGDALTIALGYHDTGPQQVFAGSVEAVCHSSDGSTRITLTNASWTLAAFRIQQSFEDQSVGDVVAELAARARVRTGTIESGSALSFLVLDGAVSAWQHLARLARISGLSARISAADELQLSIAGEGEPVQTFTWGVDVLALEHTASTPPFDAVTVWGEGAAGSDGKQAWNWLTKQAAPVTGQAGSGSRTRSFADPALRTSDAVRAAAQALADAAARAARTGRLVTAGAPAVSPGQRIAIAGTRGGELDGEYLVERVRHSFDKRAGFRTSISFVIAAAGPGGGLLGGLP